MRVLLAPVLVGDRICRIVSPIDSLLEVEEWVGEWWEPSSVTLTAASHAPPASDLLLRERGVPVADRHATERSVTDPEIQSLLRAREPQVTEASVHASPDTRPTPGPRPREYPGNARFLRGRQASKQHPD